MASCGHGQDLPHLPVRCRVGRSAHPLRVMDRNGIFPARWTATGRRYYIEADALRLSGKRDEAPKGLTAVYCRVSRRGRQADLECQVAAMEMYCLDAGVVVDEWRSEIGGGPDFKHPVFLSLRERMEARAETVEDLMAVVHTFSGRLSGLRAYHKHIQGTTTDG